MRLRNGLGGRQSHGTWRQKYQSKSQGEKILHAFMLEENHFLVQKKGLFACFLWVTRASGVYGPFTLTASSPINWPFPPWPHKKDSIDLPGLQMHHHQQVPFIHSEAFVSPLSEGLVSLFQTKLCRVHSTFEVNKKNLSTCQTLGTF